ncbi:MAG: transporter substrate-binding domain-containing protein [Anaerovoracaceae bacterium]|jgi:putative lysine transport system substrate-binding protein|nr:transporter substrate-binding domain-containing protein [Bacillota bacterium]MDY2671479.1 transporter substrate-binding domain-containing protein [Anaerovoracaceae bacterium]
MISKKKITAVVIAVLMMCTMLVGCGSSSTAPGSSASGSAATESAQDSKDSVLNTKVLRVGMECGYAPYNWTQSDDSNGAVKIHGTNDYANGYDVMMAKKLAEGLGYTVDVYKIDWDSLPVALQSGKIDCVIAGQSITKEREKTVDFTNPYYYATIVGLVKKDSKYAGAQGLADLKGVTASSQINTVWYDKMLPQIEDANIKPAFESVPNMLVALESGSIDYVCTDRPTAMAACVSYPDMQMLEFTGDDNFKASEEDINIGISVQKGNTTLRDQLNTQLAKLTKDDFNKTMEDAISVQPLSDDK